MPCQDPSAANPLGARRRDVHSAGKTKTPQPIRMCSLESTSIFALQTDERIHQFETGMQDTNTPHDRALPRAVFRHEAGSRIVTDRTRWMRRFYWLLQRRCTNARAPNDGRARRSLDSPYQRWARKSLRLAIRPPAPWCHRPLLRSRQTSLRDKRGC
jgi:hypothetical protein